MARFHIFEGVDGATLNQIREAYDIQLANRVALGLAQVIAAHI